MSTIHWNVDANGNWATTVDWNLHRLPNSTDDVSIDTAHRHFITHSSGTDTVHTLTVGNDYFTVSGGSLTIDSTASFAHQLKVSGGTLRFDGAATTVHLVQHDSTISGAGTLTVTGTGGPATFSSNLLQTGSGTTVLQGASTFGAASVSYFGLGGGRTLENQGSFTLAGTGVIALAYNPFGANSGGATLKNDAGAVIDIQGSNQIRTIGNVVTSFRNAGMLEKTVGTGVSIIGVDTNDSGLITVGTGTLWLLNKITGDGTLGVSVGPTLRVDAFAAATLEMRFNGGTLALNDSASFKATIHAFGAGDTIDLLGATATKATLGAGDTLVIKNGTTTVATLQLAGNHTSDTFHVASDGLTGTNITVTPGPAPAARLITAMAGFGGDAQASVSVFSEAHYARPPILAGPRMAMA